MNTHDAAQPDVVWVGDNLALDFINTEYGLGPLHREVLHDADDVLAWLRSAALPAGAQAPEGLLELARALRKSARDLVQARMEGRWADPSLVNAVLKAGNLFPELACDTESGVFKTLRRPAGTNAEGLLAPVAEALVELLTEIDAKLVRQCEGDHCTLLFHDQTKSHRRRWCSMSACGNRMKVAAYRARNKGV